MHTFNEPLRKFSLPFNTLVLFTIATREFVRYCGFQKLNIFFIPPNLFLILAKYILALSTGHNMRTVVIAVKNLISHTIYKLY